MLSVLKEAEAAVSRGDYGQGIALLEPLVKSHPLPGKAGSTIRMLMVTALMGKGEEQKAIKECKLLTTSIDNDIRQNAKQLLNVLEAPSLERPKNWSIYLPKLEMSAFTGDRLSNISNSKNTKKIKVSHPPTGPTNGLSFGFAISVFTALMLLSLLLSGCMRITTKINLPGPDRICINWEIKSYSGKFLPWQTSIEDALIQSKSKLKVKEEGNGVQLISGPKLTSREANILLQKTFKSVNDASFLELEKPQLILNESNWLILVKQVLILNIDLKNLNNLPGLDLSVLIEPPHQRGDLITSPLESSINNKFINWKLKPGEFNKLELHSWQWNWLGIVVISTVFLMALLFGLQLIRLKLGFGFSELPP